jgi:hypothetical protein
MMSETQRVLASSCGNNSSAGNIRLGLLTPRAHPPAAAFAGCCWRHSQSEAPPPPPPEKIKGCAARQRAGLGCCF